MRAMPTAISSETGFESIGFHSVIRNEEDFVHEKKKADTTAESRQDDAIAEEFVSGTGTKRSASGGSSRK